jgi:hypothetical protein
MARFMLGERFPSKSGKKKKNPRRAYRGIFCGCCFYYPLRQSCAKGCVPEGGSGHYASNLDVRSSHIRRDALEGFPNGESQEGDGRGWATRPVSRRPSSLAPGRPGSTYLHGQVR